MYRVVSLCTQVVDTKNVMIHTSLYTTLSCIELTWKKFYIDFVCTELCLPSDSNLKHKVIDTQGGKVPSKKENRKQSSALTKTLKLSPFVFHTSGRYFVTI